MGRQVFGHLQENRAPSHVTLEKKKAITPNVPLLLPPALRAERDITWSVVSQGQQSQLHPLPNACGIPRQPTGGVEQGAEKALTE